MLGKKQCYHLEPPEGLMNDPNGLVWFRGTYYVFFQWNRLAKDHSHKEWGLFTSRDLVTWVFQKGALQPDKPYDHSGVHSGSALVVNGNLCMFYTGSDKNGGRRRSSQCLAVSPDGRHFEKQGVVLETPAEFTEHFRDPKVFEAGENNYYMVVGAQRKNGKGAIALCCSGDGFHWRYSHILATADTHEMVECPDLFPIDGQNVLLYCLQRRDNDNDQVLSAQAVCQTVSFDPHSGRISQRDLEQGYRLLDAGFDFFAPQTFKAPDGRRILLAWMSRMDDDQERIFAQDEPRIHCLTLPRELRLCGGRLYQSPVKELYRLLDSEIFPVRGAAVHTAWAQALPGGTAALPSRVWKLPGRTWHLALQVPGCPGGLQISMEEAVLHWDGKEIVFTRRNWTGGEEVRTCSLEKLDSLELWSDQSSIEIFLNSGEAVLSARIFPQTATPVLTVTGAPESALCKVRQITSKK